MPGPLDWPAADSLLHRTGITSRGAALDQSRCRDCVLSQYLEDGSMGHCSGSCLLIASWQPIDRP